MTWLPARRQGVLCFVSAVASVAITITLSVPAHAAEVVALMTAATGPG